MGTDFPFTSDTAFVTLLAPPRAEDPRWPALLRPLLQLDEYSLQGLVKRPPPVILAGVSRDAAQRARNVIMDGGGLALVTPWTEMERVGQPEPVRELLFDGGELVCRLRDGTATVARHDIMLLCHGVLKMRTREYRATLGNRIPGLLSPGADVAVDLGDPAVQERLARHEEVRLLLHSGRCLCVTRQTQYPENWGNRHSWRVHLLRLLREIPQWDSSVRVDAAFSTFLPPRALKVRLDKLRSTQDGGMLVENTNAPSFEFYTRWRFCLEQPAPAAGAQP